MKEHNPDEVVSLSLKIQARYRDALKELAKSNRITQIQVIEVFLDHTDHASLKEEFASKRGSKPERRGQHFALAKKLRELSPEQIAFLESLK